MHLIFSTIFSHLFRLKFDRYDVFIGIFAQIDQCNNYCLFICINKSMIFAYAIQVFDSHAIFPLSLITSVNPSIAVFFTCTVCSIRHPRQKIDTILILARFPILIVVVGYESVLMMRIQHQS